MINIETVKQNIIKKLKPLHPNKIILFGSYAYGIPNENSDLDILVIMNNYKNKWDEKEKIKNDFGLVIPYWRDSLVQCLHVMDEIK